MATDVKQKPGTQIEKLIEKLSGARGVRSRLGTGGRIHVDRPLPFLCVHRMPPAEPEATVAQFVTGEAAYLVASGAKADRGEVRDLVDALIGLVGPQFGAFVVVEVWAGADDPSSEVGPAGPRFRIESADLGALESVVAES